MVRPCVLRHRVTVLTLCPLGEPEIAIGHEPRIEPWLPRNRIACQVSRIGGRRHHSKNEPRERKSHPEKNLSSDREPSANSGLDIETKNLSATGRGRTFFVDIPFIELPISECDGFVQFSDGIFKHHGYSDINEFQRPSCVERVRNSAGRELRIRHFPNASI